MNTVNDDLQYQEAARRLNELAALKAKVDKEINDLWADPSPNPMIKDEDPVVKALTIEPGVRPPSSQGTNVRAEKLAILIGQQVDLTHAISRQSSVAMRERDRAEHRIFATESGDAYRAAIDVVIAAVEGLIAANNQVSEELKNLSLCGVVDVADVRFPFHGLWQQLPDWHQDLLHQKRQILKDVKAHAKKEQ